MRPARPTALTSPSTIAVSRIPPPYPVVATTVSPPSQRGTITILGEDGGMGELDFSDDEDEGDLKLVHDLVGDEGERR